MIFDWDGSDVRVFHERVPWGKGGTDYVQVHADLDELYGTYDDFNRALYKEAKYHRDAKAAYTIVERCISPPKLAALRENVSEKNLRPVFVYPRSFTVGTGGPTNFLPSTLATYLCRSVGGEIYKNIFQTTTQKRTQLSRLVRFLYQPKFKGYVLPKRPYVLVDDVVSSGASFASLRAHIVKGGGFIVGMNVLANVDGRDQKLAISDSSMQKLRSEFGVGVDTYWQATFGHGVELLTNQEARFLVGRWRNEPDQVRVASGQPLLEHLRQRFNEIAAAMSKLSGG